MFPSLVVTVIVAEPIDLAVTTPEEETVATEVLLEDQVTVLSVALDGVTVAVSVAVSPSDKVNELLFRETPVTCTFTVTAQRAVLPPSLVVTVIVALPPPLAVTTPEEETVATEVLLEDQLTVLSVALDGVTVAVSVAVSPSVKVNCVGLNATPDTGTVAALTFTEQVAFLAPSVVVTVIVAEPAFFVTTTPASDTVATSMLLEVHITDLSVAFAGATVAVKVAVSPSVNVNEVLSKLTPVTGITFDLTVTLISAFLPPSSVVT